MGRLSFLGFNRSEAIGVFVILLSIITLTFFNMQSSLKKGRDATRKDDVRDIFDALIAYGIDNNSFPPSSNGQIVACPSGPCKWGVDPLEAFLAQSREPYLEKLPPDPQNSAGVKYHYISTQRRFQIFGSFEDDRWDEYSPEIEALGISCGTRTCNFGRASHGVPLDKLLPEYENEIGVDESTGSAAIILKNKNENE